MSNFIDDMFWYILGIIITIVVFKLGGDDNENKND